MLGDQTVTIKAHNVAIPTDDATIVPSALQKGLIAYGNNQRIVGTGKSFEFASYGGLQTNTDVYIPSDINVIELSSLDYPIKLTSELVSHKNIDFSTDKVVAKVTVSGTDYDLVVNAKSNNLTVKCNKSLNLQAFYGKDNYT